MSQEIANKISEAIKEHVHGAVEKVEFSYEFPVITINKDHIHQVLSFLKTDPDLNFHFLTDLTGMQTEDEKHLGVIYHLHNMIKNQRVRIKTFFPITHPEIPTATDIWKGANWMERETR